MTWFSIKCLEKGWNVIKQNNQSILLQVPFYLMTKKHYHYQECRLHESNITHGNPLDSTQCPNKTDDFKFLMVG